MGFLFWDIHPAIAALITACAAWGLAEKFVRRSGMALTAIALLQAYLGGIFVAVFNLAAPHATTSTAVLAASAVTCVMAWPHWKRFHVPLTVACGALAAVCFGFAQLTILFPDTIWLVQAFFFCAGLVVLTLALRWDATDVARKTRRSDVAFWLHLAAAPMLVHPFFSLLGIFDDQITLAKAWIVIALYLLLAFFSLCLDRRALMVSSLAYVVYAFTVIFRNSAVVGREVSMAALVIGASLLLLAVLWQPARARALKRLPPSIRRYLPPVAGASLN